MPARPLIELEKPRFASVETIFFWIGVTAPDDYLIPQSLWSTCRLTITRPDGTVRVDQVTWPIDGPGDRGWRGGHGLGLEAPQLGKYTLVFEFGGHRTPPQSFTVEDVPILSDLGAEFVFTSPLVLGSPDTSATLTISNRSKETMRFFHWGQNQTQISGVLEKTSADPWSRGFVVPEYVLLKAGSVSSLPFTVLTLSWAAADGLPLVTVAPGGVYRLRLPLFDVLARDGDPRPGPPGQYQLRLSTVALLLIGQRDGPLRDLSPIRLPISSAARAIALSPAVQPTSAGPGEAGSSGRR